MWRQSPSKLRIPDARALLLALALSGSVAAQPQPFVPRAEWGSHPLPMPEHFLQQPSRVVLHHSGVLWKEGEDARRKIAALQSWGQREKGWQDLPYHFLIAPDGTIFEGRELRYRPESNTDYDLDGVVNVHLWGNFEEQSLWLPQLQSAARLLAWLRLPDWSAHCWEAPGQTRCPGQNLLKVLESGRFQEWIDQLEAGEEPDWRME